MGAPGPTRRPTLRSATAVCARDRAAPDDPHATGINNDDQNDNAAGSGAAYVFVRSGGTWVQEAYLKASNTDANDAFGTDVAISGDTIVVGADGESSNATSVDGNQTDDSAPQAGAAYVFVRSASTWTQQAYLKASNAQAADRFGGEVAISGETIVVGAYREDSAATGINGNELSNSLSDAGAVHVFFRRGQTWTQSAYVKASNTGAADLFGLAVAVSGDTVVSGADQEDSMANSVSDSGAAYVFR